MKKKYTIIHILFVLYFSSIVEAIDYSSNNISHPHGIVSNIPETIINSNASTFDISGGIKVNNTVFHEFKQFNIHEGEQAIFHDSDFNNTVAQVTGTDYSWINGTLKSYSNNFFLINSNGLMFGPDTSLDVAGSFYASTANEFNLSDTLTTDDISRKTSVLNIPPIVSFGFINDNVSKISVTGKSNETNNQYITGLNVSKDHTISFISGDILISDNAQIQATGGNIQLISVVSKGSVFFSNNEIQMSGFSKLGEINILNQSTIDVSGSGGGNYFIRAEKFTVNNSKILAITKGSENGGFIDINVENMTFTNGAYIDSSTISFGNAGTIQIESNGDVLFEGENESFQKSGIILQSSSILPNAGNSGTITIDATKVSFLNGASIDSATLGTGNGGEINIFADEKILFYGKTFNGRGSHLEVASLSILEGAGKAGSIVLESENIHFGGLANINSTTDGTGMSGHVSIKAHETFSMYGEKNSNRISLIIAGTWLERSNGGQGGHIFIYAKNLDFKNNVMINSSTAGEGQGGRIYIDVSETASFDDGCTIQVVTSSKHDFAGDGGNLHLKAKNLILSNGSTINSTTFGHGKAGQILLDVEDQILLTGNTNQISSISGEVSKDSNGGHGDIVEIFAGEITLLDNSMITTTSSNTGNAGNIKIDTKILSLYGKSSIISRTINAIGGNAGNIEIETQNLSLQGFDTLISTSSNGSGKGGSIIVNSEVIDIKSGQITSESLYDPNSQFESFEQFQKNSLTTGNIVEFPEGNKLIRYYVYKNQLFSLENSLYFVENMDDLNELGNKFSLSTGDVAWIKNPGGTPTKYIYSKWYRGRSWTLFNLSLKPYVFQNIDEIYSLEGVYNEDDTPPYPNGTLLTFYDTIGEKNSTFIYCHANYTNDIGTFVRPVLLNQFNIQNIDNLSGLKEQNALQNNALAVIQGESGEIESTYILHSDEWIKLNETRTFDNHKIAIEHLVQCGDIAKIQMENQEQIFTGNEWIDLKNIYSVDDKSELSLLNAQDGDIAKISKIQEDISKSYLYSNSKWTPFFQSGGAGIININASKINIGQKSSISTDSISSGGGKISINTDRAILLNSDITTNVKDGIGNGGDINIETDQFALNKSRVSANAIDGDGGAIFILSDNFIKSSDTIIEASSERGNEGTVKIDAPDLDIDSKIMNLPTDFLNASQWMRTQCTMRDSEQTSRLIFKKHVIPSIK
ncbi:filamentous hemagglutinin family outer membrane protein [Candidatus Magnetomorum sp. HK-1]|nr:filamentous hemagglutinin family outer membrane protein [Candidatus Magnetomorum sp. HK-1]